MSYTVYENSIVAELNARLAEAGVTGVDVKAVPETRNEISTGAVNSAILISYLRSEFKGVSPDGLVLQETAMFTAYVRAKKRRDLKGVYWLLRFTQLVVLGFTLPTGGTPITLQSVEPMEAMDKDVLEYALIFEFKLTISAIDRRQLGAALQSIKFQNSNGDEVTINDPTP